ncbi:MAG: MATE family efflux transporter [Lentisphaeria bacterium]|jgi:putative MATE family efflux protein|nr:MATE family efflux transporter [Lentisphaeria bacterium]
MKKHIDLTQGHIGRQMIGMAVPMLAGTFSMTAFNLADTWFVSKLGKVPMAAMSFTFPVAMVLGSVAMALGMGSSVVVSQALGEGSHEKAKQISADCMLLGLVLVEVLGLLALALSAPIFRAMNASEDVLPLIRQYLVWYLPFAGVVFLSMPAAGVLRAAGDAKRQSLIMVTGAVLNCILDPMLIFGYGWFPALGIRGASIATTLTQGSTFFMCIYILHRRYGLAAWPQRSLAKLMRSWNHILHIAGPAFVSNMLMPVSAFVLTALVARHGDAAVAAYGAGGRVEMFAYLCPMALGISLVPLVGQNYGAGRYDRVEGCRRWSERLALGWGAVVAVVFFLAAPFIAPLFAHHDEGMERHLVLYLRIMPFGYGLREVLRYISIFLNAISRPMASLVLNALFLVGFNVPFALLGEWLFGLAGVFGGVVLGSNLAGLLALAYGRRRVNEAALARVAVNP